MYAEVDVESPVNRSEMDSIVDFGEASSSKSINEDAIRSASA